MVKNNGQQMYYTRRIIIKVFFGLINFKSDKSLYVKCRYTFSSRFVRSRTYFRTLVFGCHIT